MTGHIAGWQGAWLSLSAITALGLALLPGSTLAQPKPLKEQLVGTYTLVSVASTTRDGTKVNLLVNPKGLIIFDAGGHYTQVLVRRDRPNSRPTTAWRALRKKTKLHWRAASDSLGLGP